MRAAHPIGNARARSPRHGTRAPQPDTTGEACHSGGHETADGEAIRSSIAVACFLGRSRAAGRYRLRHPSMVTGSSAAHIVLQHGLRAVLSADQIRASRPMTRAPQAASIDSSETARS